MPARRLLQLLDENQIKYVLIRHSTAYTAQEIAESAHIPRDELAKTVIVKLDGDMVMAVVRGSDRVDLERLREVAGASTTELAIENEFQTLFPNVEAGAMPPFGSLYEMDTFVDEGLREDEEIAFNAGTHTELVKLRYEDFERLVKPRLANFRA